MLDAAIIAGFLAVQGAAYAAMVYVYHGGTFHQAWQYVQLAHNVGWYGIFR